MPSNNEYLKKYIKTFREKYANTEASVYFSHWPEMLCQPTSIEKHDDLTFASWETDCLVDSIQILTKKLYKEWWLTDNWKSPNSYDTHFPRPDFTECIYQHKKIKTWKVFLPLQEWCRHFDGYGHLKGRPKILNKDCPVLSLPNGFFEKNMKIYIGKNYKPNFINFNPTAKSYTTDDPAGADYKWGLEDIPEFWKDRVLTIEVEEGLSDEELLNGRKRALLEVVFSHSKHFEDKKSFIFANLLGEIMGLHGFKKLRNRRNK